MEKNEQKEVMERERKSLTIDAKEFNYLLEGSKEKSQIKDEMYNLIRRDPFLYYPNKDLSLHEKRKRSLVQMRRFVQIMNTRTFKDEERQAFWSAISAFDSGLSMRLYVHYILFQESIKTQGTVEQWEHWKPLIEQMRVIGCFAMTELGHSSSLTELETTATYIPSTHTFLINSPTTTSFKWWIGMAAHTATHTVCLARIYIQDDEINSNPNSSQSKRQKVNGISGLGWFIVPLRDLETGQLLPGVTTGDLGLKYGRDSLDNGFITFSNTSVPFAHYLPKFSTISFPRRASFNSKQEQEQNDVPPPPAYMAYNTLIGERLVAVNSCLDFVNQGLTISLRYSVIRYINSRPIIWYQSHSYSLISILSSSYVISLLKRALIPIWLDLLESQSKNYNNEILTLDVLKEWHCLSSCLKGTIGWFTADSLEKMRRSLGGHGYLQLNQIAALIGDFGVVTTGGGDNIVLLQQSSRILIREVDLRGNATNSENNNESNANQGFLDQFFIESKDSKGMITIVTKFRNLVKKKAQKIIADMNTVREEVKDIKEADIWNELQIETVKLGQLYGWWTVMKFWESNWEVETNKAGMSSTAKQVMESMWTVFVGERIRENEADLIEFGVMSKQELEQVKQDQMKQIKQVRKEVMGLVDGFGYPDWVIKSPLGRADGNVYEKYFEMVSTREGSVKTLENWKEDVVPILKAKY